VIILDTHALVWWRAAPEKLGRGGPSGLRDDSQAIGCRRISFWKLGC